MKSLQKQKKYLLKTFTLKYQTTLTKAHVLDYRNTNAKHLSKLIILLKNKLKIVYNYLLSSFKISILKSLVFSNQILSIITKINTSPSINMKNNLIINTSNYDTVFLNSKFKRRSQRKELNIFTNESRFFFSCINILMFKSVKINTAKKKKPLKYVKNK